jgi:hypothetical protein
MNYDQTELVIHVGGNHSCLPQTTKLVSFTQILTSISRFLGRNVIVCWWTEIHSGRILSDCFKSESDVNTGGC